MQHGGIYDRLSRLSAIGSGSVPGVPLIEMISDKRVLIENHQGICRYTREQICIYAQCGIICVNGQNLYLEKMSKEQMVITGNVNGVHWCRGVKHGN